MGDLVSLDRARAYRGLPPATPPGTFAPGDLVPAQDGWQGARVLVLDTHQVGQVAGWHRRYLMLVVRIARSGRPVEVRLTGETNLLLLPWECA